MPGQVIVQPGFEHGAEHLAHQILESARILHQHRLGERVEGRNRPQRWSRATARRSLLPNVRPSQLRFAPAHACIQAWARFRRKPRRRTLRSCGIAAPRSAPDRMKRLERDRWRRRRRRLESRCRHRFGQVEDVGGFLLRRLIEGDGHSRLRRLVAHMHRGRRWLRA